MHYISERNICTFIIGGEREERGRKNVIWLHSISWRDCVTFLPSYSMSCLSLIFLCPFICLIVWKRREERSDWYSGKGETLERSEKWGRRKRKAILDMPVSEGVSEGQWRDSAISSLKPLPVSMPSLLSEREKLREISRREILMWNVTQRKPGLFSGLQRNILSAQQLSHLLMTSPPLPSSSLKEKALESLWEAVSYSLVSCLFPVIPAIFISLTATSGGSIVHVCVFIYLRGKLEISHLCVAAHLCASFPFSLTSPLSLSSFLSGEGSYILYLWLSYQWGKHLLGGREASERRSGRGPCPKPLLTYILFSPGLTQLRGG